MHISIFNHFLSLFNILARVCRFRCGVIVIIVVASLMVVLNFISFTSNIMIFIFITIIIITTVLRVFLTTTFILLWNKNKKQEHQDNLAVVISALIVLPCYEGRNIINRPKFTLMFCYMVANIRHANKAKGAEWKSKSPKLRLRNARRR